jgi:hypothetical protein
MSIAVSVSLSLGVNERDPRINFALCLFAYRLLGVEALIVVPRGDPMLLSGPARSAPPTKAVLVRSELLGNTAAQLPPRRSDVEQDHRLDAVVRLQVARANSKRKAADLASCP